MATHYKISVLVPVSGRVPPKTTPVRETDIIIQGDYDQFTTEVAGPQLEAAAYFIKGFLWILRHSILFGSRIELTHQHLEWAPRNLQIPWNK